MENLKKLPYQSLACIDPQDKKNHVRLKHVEVGFAARLTLKEATAEKAVNEFKIQALKSEVPLATGSLNG